MVKAEVTVEDRELERVEAFEERENGSSTIIESAGIFVS